MCLKSIKKKKEKEKIGNDLPVLCRKCFQFEYDIRRYKEHVLNLEWFYFKRMNKYSSNI